MNFSWKKACSYNSTCKNLTPKPRNESVRLASLKSYKKHELTGNDSLKTLIDNRSISQSINSSILTMNLKAYKYKRAETELRGILKKNISPQLNIKVNRQKSFLSNSVRMRKLEKTLKYDKLNLKTDSSLSQNEANLIIDEYRNITKPKLWNSILINYQSNPKQLLNLIPISLSTKFSSLPYKNKQKAKQNMWKKNNKPKLLKKNEKKNDKEITNLNILNNDINIIENIESIKNVSYREMEDWSTSLLYYNIKHNINKNTYNTYKEEELLNLIKKLPYDDEEIQRIKKNCLRTIKFLLMELLGTNQDYIRFKIAYQSNLPSTIKYLISNCLNLYKLKYQTGDILTTIIKREKLLKNINLLEKNDIINVYKLSKTIRDKINNWLACGNVPFKQFIYKKKDYINKMSEDLLILQSALSNNYQENN